MRGCNCAKMIAIEFECVFREYVRRHSSRDSSGEELEMISQQHHHHHHQQQQQQQHQPPTSATSSTQYDMSA